MGKNRSGFHGHTYRREPHAPKNPFLRHKTFPISSKSINRTFGFKNKTFIFKNKTSVFKNKTFIYRTKPLDYDFFSRMQDIHRTVANAIYKKNLFFARQSGKEKVDKSVLRHE